MDDLKWCQGCKYCISLTEFKLGIEFGVLMAGLVLGGSGCLLAPISLDYHLNH
jgi:hypothetical protein